MLFLIAKIHIFQETDKLCGEKILPNYNIGYTGVR